MAQAALRLAREAQAVVAARFREPLTLSDVDKAFDRLAAERGPGSTERRLAELTKLFSRGRSYAFLGQAIQHVHPVPTLWVNWLINQFFLWCDRRLRHDILTMGWTVVAQKPNR